MRSPIRLMLLVPFYANAAFLERTLRSVIAQDDRQWEAVVVDDSPGGYEAEQVVRGLDDQRIGYARNASNLGVAGSFNRCIELARERSADVCAIVHADDELEPRYVGRLKQVHAEWPDAACVAPKVTVINGAGAPTRTVADSVKALMWPHRAPALVGEAQHVAMLVLVDQRRMMDTDELLVAEMVGEREEEIEKNSQEDR